MIICVGNSFIAGLIKQSFQLQAQVTLASLRWCHTLGECAKSYARKSICICSRSDGGTSTGLNNLYHFRVSLQNRVPDSFTPWNHNFHSDFCNWDATLHNYGVSATDDKTATQAAWFEGLMTLPNKMRFAVIPLPHSPRGALRSNRPHCVRVRSFIIKERNKMPFKTRLRRQCF
jgi:hypothetical protein